MPVALGSVVRRVGFSSATLLGCGLLRWLLCSGFAARAVWLFWALRWHPHYVFVARLVWFACGCAGIRAMPSCFMRRPCAGIRLAPSRRGRCCCVLASALASAICLRASRVAPVRGGTYFSLPPQRKVGKRKRLTPPGSVCLRAPNRSYASHGNHVTHVRCQRVCLRAPTGSYASHGNYVTHVRCQRSCAAPHPLHMSALQHALPDSPRPPRWQTVCRPLVLHTHHFGPIAHAFHPIRALPCTTRQPTHSLPPGRRKPFAAASLSTGI
ncbi:hypothetical protein SAMN04487926_102362 [Paraburkholderia steynii]|uniref:Uncharacterized protein n=1 Tax=Paraburkholderia steynii TaxID=1245441 RepID=A0A7Z7B1P6_9BURK|nr:hypothetical protein SAMN04487926_102362 [Paraburkholderia steynii]